MLFANTVDVGSGMSRQDVVWIVWRLMTSSSEQAACDIKGNISYETEEKIYHVPGCQSYNATVINEAKGSVTSVAKQKPKLPAGERH